MEPRDLTHEICRCYIKDQLNVDSALIARVNGLNRSRNLAGLTSCSRYFDWAKHTVDDWRFLRQVEAFFKKNASFADRGICEDHARSAFFEAEQTCSLTNTRLRCFSTKPHLLDEEVAKKIRRAQRYICNVLGDFNHFLDELPNLVRVTPGATAHSSRRNSLPQMKLKKKIFSTKRSGKYLKAIFHIFGEEHIRILPTSSNRVELVPKNWKTSRTIACEPEGLLPLQLAFDSFAKKRLRFFGIDLSDQSRNQNLAKRASVDNSLATVDFKAASDTISYNVVDLLFPVDWLNYLCDVRSPRFRGAFGEGTYSKFSSMGNGSTFCIETLIFASLCYACGSEEFSVYGDDVIIESKLYSEYKRLAHFLGFTINEEKSFHDGPFRESCGFDSFNGIDVTPVYIRNVDKRKAFLCHLVNTISSVATPGGELCELCLSLVKDYKLPFVPHSESTLSGIWILPDNARAKKVLYRKGYVDYFKAYTARYKKRSFIDSRGYYLWFLYKNSQVLFSGPWELNTTNYPRDTITSAARVFDHAYVRKRVCWFPAEAIPDHLYWWSDYVLR